MQDSQAAMKNSPAFIVSLALATGKMAARKQLFIGGLWLKQQHILLLLAGLPWII